MKNGKVTKSLKEKSKDSLSKIPIPKSPKNIRHNYFAVLKKVSEDKNRPITPSPSKKPKYLEELYSTYSSSLQTYLRNNRQDIKFYGSKRYDKCPFNSIIKDIKANKSKVIEKLRDKPVPCSLTQYDYDKIILTPMPNKSRTTLRSSKEKEDFRSAERSVVVMRTVEYTHAVRNKIAEENIKVMKEFEMNRNDENCQLEMIKLFKKPIEAIENWWLRVKESKRRRMEMNDDIRKNVMPQDGKEWREHVDEVKKIVEVSKERKLALKVIVNRIGDSKKRIFKDTIESIKNSKKIVIDRTIEVCIKTQAIIPRKKEVKVMGINKSFFSIVRKKLMPIYKVKKEWRFEIERNEKNLQCFNNDKLIIDNNSYINFINTHSKITIKPSIERSTYTKTIFVDKIRIAQMNKIKTIQTQYNTDNKTRQTKNIMSNLTPQIRPINKSYIISKQRYDNSISKVSILQKAYQSYKTRNPSIIDNNIMIIYHHHILNTQSSIITKQRIIKCSGLIENKSIDLPQTLPSETINSENNSNDNTQSSKPNVKSRNSIKRNNQTQLKPTKSQDIQILHTQPTEQMLNKSFDETEIDNTLRNKLLRRIISSQNKKISQEMKELEDSLYNSSVKKKALLLAAKRKLPAIIRKIIYLHINRYFIDIYQYHPERQGLRRPIYLKKRISEVSLVIHIQITKRKIGRLFKGIGRSAMQFFFSRLVLNYLSSYGVDLNRKKMISLLNRGFVNGYLITLGNVLNLGLIKPHMNYERHDFLQYINHILKDEEVNDRLNKTSDDKDKEKNDYDYSHAYTEPNNDDSLDIISSQHKHKPPEIMMKKITLRLKKP